MAMRRQARLLLTLSMVLGAHLIVVWFVVSSPRLSLKTGYRSLQIVWIARPALPETAREPEATTRKGSNTAPRHPIDRRPVAPSIVAPSTEENAIQPAPDWTEELRLAAKNALAAELARQRHELDFAHAFPTPPKKPQQFAWDYAATHRIEALPEGGMLLHLSDNCVLVLFPLPFVGCGIGKRPANGDLFEHRHDQ
jgi:hypothetical protein